MRVNRALSQVSTSVSICMAFLQIALEGCHRQEVLVQAAGDVSWDLYTSIVPTKGNYNGIVISHTGVLHQSQRAIPLTVSGHVRIVSCLHSSLFLLR